ncbi:RHS repeat-associated core domain-containing protein, partial [Leptospira interrogans]|uniref:RHS repeat-associated core domain-containing protein n=1 Tax=Leptospira interrogans TaxID=173 RepID=UPI0007738B57
WYDESGFRIRKSSLEPKNNVFSNVEILYPSKFFGLEFIESENVISSVNNVYLNGVRIAALNEAGALAYYLTDQVDSVSTVLDDEGNTLSQMQYLPYGETFVQRGDLNFSPKFNSQELDRESGFYFYNARYYDPGIARFTSADTLIPDEYNSQAWNRFAYVYNNPIGAKDPTGHVPQKSCGPEYCGGGFGGGGDGFSHWANRSKNSDAGQGPSSGGVRGSSGNSGSGRNSVKGSNTVSNDNQATSSRAARREVMRKEGIPTSQQPKSQSKNASGREYQYEVPKNGGGKQTKSVQQQTMDRSHPNEKHWEAGRVKTDKNTGEINYNNYGRPKLVSDKSKVNYE